MNSYPTVQRDDSSAAFYDAASRGELQLKADGSGGVWPPQASLDPGDPDVTLQPVIASGGGTLMSWSVVHQAPHPLLAGAVPYVSAVVELSEGPWLFVRLYGDVEQCAVGAKVHVRFDSTGSQDQPGEVVPVFELGAG
ncbi:Zn-ribbon domain-containing OB-fold protein [Mycobacterium sp. shizuoka-1]|uniref:Zn-ribbon domain-containing OB-fold protein n=1 Tax=Mycobacterium sp. shizuoka-1 TaxID=2039281 RepID=UPI000C05D5D7|nr:OB-fold domain-containing protein [Mycobacterium sp. shizuoka-1]GAY17689.1 hypothetical protein MSZK_44150 [Mycobacterium sp. shizuoka-1]